ncbi:MAG: type II secretion system F family protein, partial [Candidatus Omnitrophica bacterium]|nr:type II secretion system F family protein [Candidatus Omnitrophota bacterium]
MRQLEIDPAESAEVNKRPRIPLKDKRVFFSALARLLRGGVPLLRALDVLANETRARDLRVLMQKTSALIGEGKSLSQCFSLFPSVFPPYQLSLLEAGEASGRMEEVLECIARKIEREEETRGKVREAVAYPAFIALFGLVTVLILLIWIVPRIASVYDDFGEPLPGFTRWVIGLSRGMKFLVP